MRSSGAKTRSLRSMSRSRSGSAALSVVFGLLPDLGTRVLGRNPRRRYLTSLPGPQQNGSVRIKFIADEGRSRLAKLEKSLPMSDGNLALTISLVGRAGNGWGQGGGARAWPAVSHTRSGGPHRHARQYEAPVETPQAESRRSREWVSHDFIGDGDQSFLSLASVSQKKGPNSPTSALQHNSLLRGTPAPQRPSLTIA